VALSLAPLRAFKVIEEEPADLSLYGLDKPSVITINLVNGNNIVLDIGNKTATGENYYVKRKDESRVCTVSKAYIDRLLFKLYDVKSKVLYAVTAADVTDITMYKGGTMEYSGFKTVEQWRMTKPMDSLVDSTLFQPVIEDIVAIEVKNYVTPKYENLEMYGLDAPRYEFIMKALGIEYHIQIGKKLDNEDAYYGKFADSTEIFTVDAADLQFLDKPIEQVLEINVYLVAFEDIKKIELNIDNVNYVFDIVHDPKNPRTGDAKVTLNGTTDVSFKMEDEFQWIKRLFLELISLEMGTTDTTFEPTGNADISLTYTHVTDNVVLRIDFVNKDDVYYAVRKNGLKSGVLVLKSEFDKDGGVRAIIKYLNDYLKK
jgi:hypothetical protein